MLVGFPLRSHMTNTCRLPFTVVPRMSNSMLIQNHLCRKKVFSTEERDLFDVSRVSLEVAHDQYLQAAFHCRSKDVEFHANTESSVSKESVFN